METIEDLTTEIYNGHRFDIMKDTDPDNDRDHYFAYVYDNDQYDESNETSITVGGETIEECEEMAKKEIDGFWR